MIHRYGNPEAAFVLIQPVDARDLSGMEEELAEIRKRTKAEFLLIAVEVEDWMRDLSPWKAEAVFGKQGFAGEGAALLKKILELCKEEGKSYYIGGYSLAGLFALWASCQTERFEGVAAASPSVWFPGFLPYLKETGLQSKCVYLSLGDREEKTRNPRMARVGDCLREAFAWMQEEGICCHLEWNEGNHFQEVKRRVAKAFAWILNNNERTAAPR